MRTTFRLARVAGIDIGANWTWLIVFGLVLWSLADSILPDQNPGLSDTAYWLMAVVAAVAFFGSILLHELGHALVARREGVEIEGITLWLFGGVAKLRGDWPSARAEFRIAVAGPLVSAAIAGALLVAGRLARLPEAVDGVVFWVGWINAFVLAFNLLPALPLDGGRLLHAALWGWKRDLVWATGVGATIGRGFGWLMIGGGIVMFVLGSATGGLWLAFIGWFLNIAAQAEARHVVAHERLGGLRVRDLMVAEPVGVEPWQTVGEVLDGPVRRHRYTTYPVLDHGRAVGLLPFRCVAATPRSEWDERHVGDCMVPRADVPTFTGDEPAADALDRLAESELGRGLVVDDGDLVGLLSISDLVAAVQLGRRRQAVTR